MAERNMPEKELREVLGLSKLTIYNYRKAGMPYKQTPNGRNWYNLQECVEWIKETYNRKIEI